MSSWSLTITAFDLFNSMFPLQKAMVPSCGSKETLKSKQQFITTFIQLLVLWNPWHDKIHILTSLIQNIDHTGLLLDKTLQVMAVTLYL